LRKVFVLPTSSEHKSGFISLVGRPNVGKSTLLNQLLGQKLAIVSPKPQTTRNKILGVKTLPHAQLIFMDTPGIYHHLHSKLDKRMQRTTYNCLREVDLVLWLVEANPAAPSDQRLQRIARTLKPLKVPIFLLINKIDLLPDKRRLLPLISELGKWLDFAEIIPICALDAQTTDPLIEKVLPYLPPGPRYFPEDMITDQPERFLLAEIIREKVYQLTYQEVPYSCAVVIEDMQEDSETNLLHIAAVIYGEQESQKGILVGKSGGLIKKIGTLARKEMEQILGVKIYLQLWVKIRKDWRQQDRVISNMGY